MDLYILTREGIYRHEVLGIYEIIEDAMTAGEIAIEAESDAYHNIELNFAPLGEVLEDVVPIGYWSCKQSPSRFDQAKGEVIFREHKPIQHKEWRWQSEPGESSL